MQNPDESSINSFPTEILITIFEHQLGIHSISTQAISSPQSLTLPPSSTINYEPTPATRPVYVLYVGFGTTWSEITSTHGTVR